jgi:hypothetical protein
MFEEIMRLLGEIKLQNEIVLKKLDKLEQRLDSLMLKEGDLNAGRNKKAC